MSKVELSNREVCAKFSGIHWHDSKLINLHLVRLPGERKYDLQLDLDLITHFERGKVDTKRKTVIFRECRILQMDLDLLGVLICGGDISTATCYMNAVEMERKNRNKAHEFDFPQSYNPLDKCLVFLIEMINPAGELLVFARDFELL